MHSRAVTAADQLPVTAREGFVAGFDGAARHGLLVGRGQSGIAAPSAAVQRLVDDVYTHAFIAAQRPALAVPVAVLLAGALCGLLVRRRSTAVTVAETIPEVAVARS
jgi:hypothetical protein